MVNLVLLLSTFMDTVVLKLIKSSVRKNNNRDTENCSGSEKGG